VGGTVRKTTRIQKAQKGTTRKYCVRQNTARRDFSNQAGGLLKCPGILKKEESGALGKSGRGTQGKEATTLRKGRKRGGRSSQKKNRKRKTTRDICHRPNDEGKKSCGKKKSPGWGKNGVDGRDVGGGKWFMAKKGGRASVGNKRRGRYPQIDILPKRSPKKPGTTVSREERGGVKR